MPKLEDYRIKEIEALNRLNDESWTEQNQDKPNYFQLLYGITDETLDVYYDAAIQLMNENRWEEASDAFTFLIFLHTRFSKFWFYLGYCLQSQNKFDEAFSSYAMCLVLDPNDAYTYANSAQCSIALGETENAKELINAGISVCEGKEEYQELKGKLQKMLESL